MVKSRIHICSSCNESTQSEEKQDKHLAKQQQDKERNCRAPCENASGVIHYCSVRGKARKITVTLCNITDRKLDLKSTEIICK